MNLLDRLEANSTWEPNSGCRLWMGALNRDHGVVKVAGKAEQVHRVAWELERGKIPFGLWVLHNCGMAACFNVNHLRLGVRQENADDRMRHGGYVGKPGGGLLTQTRMTSAATVKHVRAGDAELDQTELRRVLAYEPESGVFRWRPRADRDLSWNHRFSGEKAGAVLPIGYRYINFNKRLRTAHRLAWLWMTGDWPAAYIDHINGNRADNRWVNLRAATAGQNGANQGLRSTNTSGVKGVCWVTSKRKWQASITVGNRDIYLGRFARFDDAVAARKAAEDEHHGVFAHIRGNA